MHKKISMKKIASSIILIFIVGYAASAQDTIVKVDPKPLKMKYQPNPDVKWSMFGMRLHMQDFGITNQYLDTCNCDDGLPLLDRANGTVAFSLYRNLSKRLAVSGDLGFSYGYISRKTPSLTERRQAWFQTARTDLYYQFTNNKLQLQPFLFGGAHVSRRSSKYYVSIPMGMGARYMVLNDNGMITGQVGYGLGTTSNIRNSFIYSLGLYINITKKKKPQAPELPKPVDTVVCPIPLVDTDCDGLVDSIDKCPTVPGPARNEGCPIVDRDHDGVNDEVDKCPDQAGDPCNEGCPLPPKPEPVKQVPTPVAEPKKELPVKPNKPTIEPKKEEVKIIQPPKVDLPESVLVDKPTPPKRVYDSVYFIIHFDFDKYSLTPNSNDVLSKVVAYLKKHPSYECVLFGHTDLEGSDQYNVKLSRNRVNAARMYLTQHGISPTRISTDYFGESQPVISTTAKPLGWKNRRVEFHFIMN
jgi:OOP family OmpA-OmpF porin